MPVFWLPENKIVFPDPMLANNDGILAIGGDLSAERLLLAYQKGIFPWFNPEDPIVWWSPDPRFVLFPEDLKVSKSMRPYFNQPKYKLTLDTCFEDVMRACQQAKRKGQGGDSWITESMLEGYTKLYHLGYAHSVEVWYEDTLVGGLYGIALGKCFFGESMFAHANNASKFGFISLVKRLQKRGYQLIDCQQRTEHLKRFGAQDIDRSRFIQLLDEYVHLPSEVGRWNV
ncbi:MAG: leucyl/phenylalanyl-tRNA--protein transferase [Bacteroidota bacterium]